MLTCQATGSIIKGTTIWYPPQQEIILHNKNSVLFLNQNVVMPISAAYGISYARDMFS